MALRGPEYKIKKIMDDSLTYNRVTQGYTVTEIVSVTASGGLFSDIKCRFRGLDRWMAQHLRGLDCSCRGLGLSF